MMAKVAVPICKTHKQRTEEGLDLTACILANEHLMDLTGMDINRISSLFLPIIQRDRLAYEKE
jgi:hypothetical protein